MSIFDKLLEKPWLSNDVIATEPNTETPAKTAMLFFLAVVTVIFFLFTITFLARSQSADFQALSGEPWLPLNQSGPLWFNSGLLLLASISLHMAYTFSLKKQLNRLVFALAIAVIFSSAFIIAQLYVWQHLANAGYFIADNPANSFFYLLTAMHGVHLLGGILALLSVIWHFYQNIELSVLHARLKLCAVYWHYLLLLWLFLFALLTSSASTYRAIAVFCGF